MRFAYNERHYMPAELAVLWGVSEDTIRRLFRHEPGVWILGESKSRKKRRYLTLRIPESVAERVYKRLSLC